MSIFEISGLVVTVVFIVYFLLVRSEVVENNQRLFDLIKEVQLLKSDLSTKVADLFNEQICTYSVDGDELQQHKSRSELQITIENMLKPLAEDVVSGERFIDEVVARINKKQVGN